MAETQKAAKIATAFWEKQIRQASLDMQKTIMCAIRRGSAQTTGLSISITIKLRKFLQTSSITINNVNSAELMTCAMCFGLHRWTCCRKSQNEMPRHMRWISNILDVKKPTYLQFLCDRLLFKFIFSMQTEKKPENYFFTVHKQETVTTIHGLNKVAQDKWAAYTKIEHVSVWVHAETSPVDKRIGLDRMGWRDVCRSVWHC